MKVVNGGVIYTEFRTSWLKSLDFFLADHFYFGAHILRESRSGIKTAVSYIRGSSSQPTPSDVQNLLKPLLGEIEKIRELCVSSNIRLVVMLVNEQDEDGSFKSIEKQYNEVVKSLCRERGVTVVDPLPVFEESAGGKPIYRQEHDHHWSSLAQKVAAKELLRVLTQENILATSAKN